MTSYPNKVNNINNTYDTVPCILSIHSIDHVYMKIMKRHNQHVSKPPSIIAILTNSSQKITLTSYPLKLNKQNPKDNKKYQSYTPKFPPNQTFPFLLTRVNEETILPQTMELTLNLKIEEQEMIPIGTICINLPSSKWDSWYTVTMKPIVRSRGLLRNDTICHWFPKYPQYQYKLETNSTACIQTHKVEGKTSIKTINDSVELEYASPDLVAMELIDANKSFQTETTFDVSMDEYELEEQVEQGKTMEVWQEGLLKWEQENINREIQNV